MVLTRSLPLGATLATRTEKNVHNGREGMGWHSWGWALEKAPGEAEPDWREETGLYRESGKALFR